MNKHINFEDTIFILNARLRMIRDLLRLDTDPGIFLEKTLDDLEFTAAVLETLAGQLAANPRLLDREQELDNLSDLEWQLGQILTEFASDMRGKPEGGGPFSVTRFPQIGERIQRLKEASAGRKKIIEETFASPDQGVSEPVVSSAELSELLKGM
jgi:hypothetical protein